MKLDSVKEICNDNVELYKIAIGTAQGSTVTSEYVVKNIVLHENRDKLIGLLLKGTLDSKNEEAPRLQKNLVKYLMDTYTGSDSKVLKEKYAEKLYKIYQNQEYQNYLERVKRFPNSKKIVENGALKLTEISQLVAKFTKESALLEKISQAINDVASTDEPKQLTFFSHIPLEDQPLIISALPKNIDDAHKLMESSIQKGCHIFISLHESTEATNKCNDFWKNAEVHKKGFNGLKVINTSVERIQKGTKENSQGETPELIETMLELDDGTKITHIHFDKWIDRTACPDEGLLLYLFKRISKLSPNLNCPITFNCQGGVGRSAASALGYYIFQMLEESKNLDTKSINIPSLICESRTHRKDILNSPYHLKTLYSLAAAIYESNRSI